MYKHPPAGEQGFNGIARALARGAGAGGGAGGHNISGFIHRMKEQKNPTQGGEV
jgi:hypothetical protein